MQQAIAEDLYQVAVSRSKRNSNFRPSNHRLTDTDTEGRKANESGGCIEVSGQCAQKMSFRTKNTPAGSRAKGTHIVGTFASVAVEIALETPLFRGTVRDAHLCRPPPCPDSKRLHASARGRPPSSASDAPSSQSRPIPLQFRRARASARAWARAPAIMGQNSAAPN